MNNLKMPFLAIFKEKYEITHTDILLNSITVASLKGNCFGKGINFEIKNISGELVVYPLEKAEEYIIKYDRLVDSDSKLITQADIKRLIETFGL